VKLKSSPVSPDFQAYRSYRASLIGAIAFFEVLSTHFLDSDPDSSLWLLTKVASVLLRRVQAGEAITETAWLESFLEAQAFFDSIRSLVSLFEIRKETHEQTVSWAN
jgi:hypothetical protein